MTKLIALLMALVAITEAASNDEAESDDELVLGEWSTFKMDNQKAYGSKAEEKYRKNIFMENKRLIDVHNSKYELGLVSFKLGINKYADMSQDEFVRTMNGFKPELSKDHKKPVGAKFVAPSLDELPIEVDWRSKGAVTGVKEQKHCGACWAFSAIGALEGQYFRRSNQLVTLSEQNLIDCAKGYGTITGCKGGNMKDAFQYIIDNKGIDSESSYRYKAEDGKCHYNPWNIGATATGFVSLEQGDEQQLKAAIANKGPVSVGIDASLRTFHLYQYGIYNDANCSPITLDHAVVVVGYGSENGKEHWVVKNSWGIGWGENGYMKVARNNGNQCGIASDASYPTVDI